MIKLILFLLLVISLKPQESFKSERLRMVNDQIKFRGIRNPEVLKAMEMVPRHIFVPEDYRKFSYSDRPLPIGYEQTISQPYIVAYMTEMLNLKGDDIVLEIGTGSGYQAAVLSEIASKVYTIEIVRPLAEEAKERLRILGYDNVMVFVGDGYIGLKEYSPFDAIMVTAGAEHIPQPLLEQLKDGGRMIIPVGSQNSIQYLVLVEKEGSKVKTEKLLPVRFVPFMREKEK